jgi:hypothetical protein
MFHCAVNPAGTTMLNTLFENSFAFWQAFAIRKMIDYPRGEAVISLDTQVSAEKRSAFALKPFRHGKFLN